MYSLTLQNSSDTIISSGDKLGQLNFAAPNESDGGASILVAGGLYVQAEGAFNASSNPASLVFLTSSADPSGLVPRLKVDQDGNLIPFVDDENTLGSNSLRFKSAHFSEGVLLSDNVPPITTNNLYNTSGTLYFNGSPYIPLPPSGLENQLLYKVSDSSNELAWIDNYATELRELVKNDTGSGILKGTVVMATGAVGDRIQVAPAVADGSVEPRYMFGVASEDIDDSTEGYVSLVGPLKGISTSGWPVGTVLWIDPNTPGALTSTQPTSPDLQMSVAIVTNESASNGRIFVRMWEQQPGLHELHDVNVDTVASGDLIAYDSSDGVWKNIQNPSGVLQGQITQNANDIVAVSGSIETYTAGSGLTLVGNEFNVWGGSGNFVELTVDNIKLDGNTISATNTNGSLIVAPNGTGALQADGDGDPRGADAVDLQMSRSASTQVASGACSTIGGGSCNTASGATSTVSGGFGNSASGITSTVSGGLANTASGNYSTVSGGIANTASEATSTVSGGYCNTASGTYSTVSGGCCNIASGNRSTVSGGCCNITNARHSTISGGHRNIIQSPTSECCSRGATISGGVGHNSSGGTLNSTTGDLTGTITCCNAGAFSTIGGGVRNCATGVCSTVSGGGFNTASGACSTVSGGRGNIASEFNSTVGGGFFNTASGNRSTVSGGAFNTASGTDSTVSGGFCNTASGITSTVSGGRGNTASGPYSTVNGGYYGKATRYGEVSHAAGRFAQNGDAQHSILVARKNTNDATANVVLFLDGVDDRLVIPAETTWMFTIKLAAHNDTNNDGAWWYFRGGIRRDASNNTTLIGNVFEESAKDTNISSASASVVADDTNEALEIRVTGVAAKNIRWVAVIDLSQVSWGTP